MSQERADCIKNKRTLSSAGLSIAMKPKNNKKQRTLQAKENEEHSFSYSPLLGKSIMSIPKSDKKVKGKHEDQDARKLESALFGDESTSIKHEDEAESVSSLFELDMKVLVDDEKKKPPRYMTDSCSVDELFAPEEVVEEVDAKSFGRDVKSYSKLETRKSKLSKWALRLFDPNRPRGLIETPTVIPLNDEFLKEFGKSQKQHFENINKPLDIDTEWITGPEINLSESKPKIEKEQLYKVKITNLSYETSLETITSEVNKICMTSEVNLIMNDEGKTKKNNPLSIGKAYVSFRTEELANKCIEELNNQMLDGRPLRVVRVTNNSNKGGQENRLNRYWAKELQVKNNETEIQRCPHCSMTSHEMWSCPLSTVCFNCGTPGHVSKECPHRRGIPKRCVCCFCFTSGHHRWRCQASPWQVRADNARCFTCGRYGHFSCKDMKWSHGLDGMFCFNCGEKGHHGANCDRPSYDLCSRNQEVGLREIERRKHRDDFDGDNQCKDKNQENVIKRGRSTEITQYQNMHRPVRARSQPAPLQYRHDYESAYPIQNSYSGYSHSYLQQSNAYVQQNNPHIQHGRGYPNSNGHQNNSSATTDHRSSHFGKF